MRIAVIGAGAAGIIAIKHCLEYDCEVVAFEQSDRIGGTWVQNYDVGKNKYGIDVHSSLYDNLVTNLPIELMCYPDEPFPDNKISFVSSDVVLSYYESFADKYNLRDYVKFEHQVVRVQPLIDNTWELIARDLPANIHKTFTFDAVLVCNGHFSYAHIPNYGGRDIFEGKEMHSHEYRNPKSFEGENILIIGGNFSAVDIVQQTAHHASTVTWSHHLKDEPDLNAFGKNVIQKPDVARLSQFGAEFIDGSKKKFSAIIYCTGYEYKFPFLSVDCGINNCEAFVKPLYKHCLNINRPSMGFIGLPNLICPNQMFSLQARFCLAFITGKKKLPTTEEMMTNLEDELRERWHRGLSKKKAHVMGPDVQEEYYNDLASTAGVKPIKPVIPRMHKYTQNNRQQDFTRFRNKKFFIIDDECFETKPI